MNSFHVSPNTTLANDALPRVVELMAKHGNHILIAVRGQTLYEHLGIDGDPVHTDRLYVVTLAPSDCRENGGSRDYLWEYVPATKWLRHYYDHRKGFLPLL